MALNRVPPRHAIVLLRKDKAKQSASHWRVAVVRNSKKVLIAPMFGPVSRQHSGTETVGPNCLDPICSNCKEPASDHADNGKCLWHPTFFNYEKVSREYLLKLEEDFQADMKRKAEEYEEYRKREELLAKSAETQWLFGPHYRPKKKSGGKVK